MDPRPMNTEPINGQPVNGKQRNAEPIYPRPGSDRPTDARPVNDRSAIVRTIKFFMPGSLLAKIVSLALLTGIGTGAFFMLKPTLSIFEMLHQNRELREAITNLTQQRQIGYAKVLSQTARDGVLYTQVRFVVTDPENQNHHVLERDYEIKGDIVFFDALIVRFGSKVVMDGREKAMYLWRRIYGESLAPESGLAIETPGEEPAQYTGLLKKLSLDQRKQFWDEIWKLSDDPTRLNAAGVQAVYGQAVYKKLKPGLIYIFNLDANGAFYPETVPAL